MRIMKTASMALAISGLVLGSTAAQAATAIDAPRSGSSLSDSESLAGGGIGWIIALVIAAGVVAVIAGDDDEDFPTSP